MTFAPHLRPATEREIEDAIRDLFARAGWYPAKTDSGMVVRGQGSRLQRGHLPLGFPDLTMLRHLPGSPLCLAVLIEVKTESGQLRATQTERHAELRDQYGLHAHVIRNPQQATALIAEGQRLAGLLARIPSQEATSP